VWREVWNGLQHRVSAPSYTPVVWMRNFGGISDQEECEKSDCGR
jgi:hypothetical protein